PNRGRSPAADFGAAPLLPGVPQLDYAAKVFKRLRGGPPNVAQVVAFRSGKHVSQLVNSRFKASFGAFQIWNQRRHRQARLGQGMRDDHGCIRELRNHFYGHKGRDLNLSSPRRCFGGNPFLFGRCREKSPDVLKTVAWSDFSDSDVRLHNHTAPHRPLNFGWRFSLNARTPSIRSSVGTI